MLDNKTRNEIMLEEKVAKIDDINFDKIYDVEEFASKQLETFEDESAFHDSVSENKISNFDDDDFIQDIQVENTAAPSYELELQPNEFLDNLVWGEDDEIEQLALKASKRKFSLSNKPLFYTFTSIALLLCILFIYNVFVIKSLEAKVSQAAMMPNGNISVLQPVEENNNITFENSATIEITEKTNYLANNNSNSSKQNTNWFNEVCSFLNKLFGGNY